MDDLDPRLRAQSGHPSPGEHRQQSSPVRASETDDASVGPSQLEQSQAKQSSGRTKLDDGHGHAHATVSGAAASSAAALEEEARKARACEACRGLKVRCEPHPTDDSQPCKRCQKAGRSCIVLAPTRKRQKKTDSRVADLEKKIDALTATLQARSSAVGGQPEGTGEGQPVARNEDDEHRRVSQPWGIGPAKTWQSSTSHSPHDRPSPGDPPRRTSTGTNPTTTLAGQKRKEREPMSPPEQLSERSRQSQPQYPSGSYQCRNPDFVERGFITPEQAEELLDRYSKQMVPHFPAILPPRDMSAAELSQTRPVLFAAIMATASSDQADLQRTLQRELMVCFAEKVFIAGEKSLDTVQAILVAVMWYWPPENFEELKFYQLIHSASVMAIDIGLGRRGGSRRTEPPVALRDPMSKRPPPPNPQSFESRRTWLACYILATNAAMALHRPVLIRWSSFMEESVRILETSPNALPSDRHLAQMVWAHKMSEDTSNYFFSEDPDVQVNLSEPSTQFTLRGMERKLALHQDSVPLNQQLATVAMTFGTVNIYMHELVLNTNGAAESDRAPFSTEALTTGMLASDSPPSAAHISALCACLTSIHSVFDIFLALPIDSARCLPVYFFVRTAYALVILIKMSFSAAKPGAELGKIMGPDDTKLLYYLEVLLEKYKELAADNKCRPAAKFLIVMAMLKTWVTRQVKDGAIPLGSTAAMPQQRQKHHPEGHDMISPPPQRPSPSQQPANTPLHLLSEVASNRNNGHRQSQPHINTAYLNGVRQPPQPFFADSAAASTPSTTSGDGGSHQSGMSGGGGPGPGSMNWMDPSTAGLGGYAGSMLPLDPGLNQSLGLEGLDFSANGLPSEAWFTDMMNVMPSMDNPAVAFACADKTLTV
ncbi:hypothetical protein LIA77_01253 [Sarocladium implicatum]|nr:hypothetical protein LIA77_01253 [Sarocladium implicatum]